MSYDHSDHPQNIAPFAGFLDVFQGTSLPCGALPDCESRAAASLPFGKLAGAAGGGSNAPRMSSETVDQDALGKDAKYVGRSKARNTRKVLFQLQKRAAWLLPEERVSNCRWTMQRKDQPVEVTRHADGRSSFAGLQTCASVWACPVCSQRISETRRQEMNHCLAWSRAEGHYVFMMTLTARHRLGDDLEEQRDAMKKALRRMRQRRDWKKMKGAALVGSVTATEVTYGANGWHVHFHIILITRTDIVDELEGLRNAWLSSLETEGLSGSGRYAFRVDRGDEAGEYVAKFGAAEEITLGQQKKGRGEGRTPFQLLHDFAFERDVSAGERFKQFAQVFKGTRQLTWSDGLRTLCGADDITDEEAANDAEGEDELVALIERDTWIGGEDGRPGARRRRVKILDAAESDPRLCRQVIFSAEVDDEPDDARVIDDDLCDPPAYISPAR